MEFTTEWFWRHRIKEYPFCQAPIEVMVRAEGIDRWDIVEIGYEQLHDVTKKPVYLKIDRNDPIFGVIKKDLEDDICFKTRINNELV